MNLFLVFGPGELTGEDREDGQTDLDEDFELINQEKVQDCLRVC